MKVLVTKCVCDVCGKEVSPNAPRFVIAFGKGEWDDVEDIPTMAKVKDACRNCYDTICALVNDPAVDKKSKVEEPAPKRVRGDCDYDKIIELWQKDYSYQDIMNKLGCSRSQVNYAVRKAKKNGEMRDSTVRKIIESADSNDGITTVVDETGLVVSTGL